MAGEAELQASTGSLHSPVSARIPPSAPNYRKLWRKFGCFASCRCPSRRWEARSEPSIAFTVSAILVRPEQGGSRLERLRLASEHLTFAARAVTKRRNCVKRDRRAATHVVGARRSRPRARLGADVGSGSTGRSQGTEGTNPRVHAPVRHLRDAQRPAHLT